MKGTAFVLGLLLLVGCAGYRTLTHVDLNGDGRIDIVSGFDATDHFFYTDSRLLVALSQADGAYLEQHLRDFPGRPYRYSFEDVDGDGDLDLRCTLVSMTRWDYIVDGDYFAPNDGFGNFGPLQPIR
jgi:hypothetical protein